VLTVDNLFASVGAKPHGSVTWGTRIPERGSGVYLITIPDPAAVVGLPEPLRFRWCAHQGIVYIGRATRLVKRVGEFYRHKYGDPRPHSRGQAILLLPQTKMVYWAACADYAEMEDRLIKAFVAVAGAMPFGNRVSARI
jgi:hypothetical protein